MRRNGVAADESEIVPFSVPHAAPRQLSDSPDPQSQKLISQFKTPKSRQRRGFRHTGIRANATAVSGEPSRNRVVGTTVRRTNPAKWPTPKHGLSIADSRATCNIRPPLPAPAGEKRLVPRKPDRRPVADAMGLRRGPGRRLAAADAGCGRCNVSGTARPPVPNATGGDRRSAHDHATGG